MQEVLNSSLGIYQAVYVLFTSNNIGELILAFLCFVVGLLTYAPRNGRDMGDFRVFWCIVVGCLALIGILGKEPLENLVSWCFVMGVMLKFSFEILYNNATP